jgi:ribosomal protein L31
MPNYTAPVEDMMFLFDKLRNNKNYNDLEKYKEVNSELVKDILEEAAKINQNLILPLAKSGDENPTVLENGVVRTPPGYKEAYSKYIEDGWTSLSCDPKYGGQGMPKTVSAFFDEMLSSASLSFKLYSELSIGAYNCISHHATDEIKEKYLPKMVEGKWSGTMCLTEPVCGTDLGLLKTKAIEQSDGTFKLSGQKIFITSGDQDLTENIIHLVIARVADSPAGTKGKKNMKEGIHPENYREVVFKDMSNEYAFLSRSAASTKETIQWEDGKEYPLIKVEVSHKSHPFYTGKAQFVDTAGRIDKFRQKYQKFDKKTAATDESEAEES